MEKADYLTHYFGVVRSQQERANMAFSHAQAAALLGQRTGTILNSGAIAIIAKAVSTNVSSFTELLPAGALFLVGLCFAITSCFASYTNLIKLSEFYELKATEEALGANKMMSNEIEKRSIDGDILKIISEQNKLNKEIEKTFKLSFWALLFSFIFFFAACLAISCADLT